MKKSQSSLLKTFACVAVLGLAAGCQPPEEESEISIDTGAAVAATDDGSGTKAPAVESESESDEASSDNVSAGSNNTTAGGSNTTGSAETPSSNITTSSETPGGETP